MKKIQLQKVASIMGIVVMAVIGASAYAEKSKSPDQALLKKVIAGEHRSADNKVRDPYRHPLETLNFFGIKSDMTVVEIWPGGGWYMEILAPYLKQKGVYYAAGFEKEGTSQYYNDNVKKLQAKIDGNSDLYGKVIVTELKVPEKVAIAPAGSADAVLTFRNIHNWMRVEGQAEKMFEVFYSTLKPGGILGVVEHRGNPEVEQDPVAKSGYVNEAYTIGLAEAAGFKLVDKSEVNANPKDTRDHPHGVWTLPPSLRKNVDDVKYKAIGESDRMTLKFVKPK